VIAIESEGSKLEALIYIPAERGKNVKLGMPVRIEPSTVKREEFGTMVATVSLEQDPENVSGYRWAVGKGPPVRLTSGTLTRAEITTRRQRPIDLVVP